MNKETTEILANLPSGFWVALGTIVGAIIGGLSGWLIAWFNYKYSVKKNKLYKLLESYAELITSFSRDINIVKSMDTLNGTSEDITWRVKKGYEMLGARVDAVFLKKATICRLLEGNNKITNTIEILGKAYNQIRDNIDTTISKNERQLEKYEIDNNRIVTAEKLLEDLRKAIHDKYKI